MPAFLDTASIHVNDDGNMFRRLAPVRECVTALGCTDAEWDALPSDVRVELWWDYCDTLPWEPLLVPAN